MTGFLFDVVLWYSIYAGAIILGLLLVVAFLEVREWWWNRDRRQHIAVMNLCEESWRLPAREPRVR